MTYLKFRVRQLGPSRCTYLTCQKKIQGIHVKEEEMTVRTVNNIIFSQKLTNWTVFENFSGSGSTRKKPKNGLSSYPKNRKKHLKSDFFSKFGGHFPSRPYFLLIFPFTQALAAQKARRSRASCAVWACAWLRPRGPTQYFSWLGCKKSWYSFYSPRHGQSARSRLMQVIQALPRLITQRFE